MEMPTLHFYWGFLQIVKVVHNAVLRAEEMHAPSFMEQELTMWTNKMCFLFQDKTVDKNIM